MSTVSERTLLVTVSGHDRPGVTRTLFGELASTPVIVQDIEQIVVRGHLILSFLLGGVPADEEESVIARVTRTSARLGMQAHVVAGADPDDDRRRNRVHVTVMGAPLRPAAVTAVAAAIADHGGNIDRIRRIASYPVTAIVFEGSGASVADLRSPLAAVASTTGADIAVQRAGLDRRGQHLVVMDVDSTLIQDEVIDLLAAHAGCESEVAAITEAAMRGELDFAQSLRARVALLQGTDAGVLDDVRRQVTLTPGARTLCRTLTRLGFRIALVSGGFIEVVAPLAAELGITDVRANKLSVRNGVLTGEVEGDIVDRAGKRDALEAFAAKYDIPMSRTIAIGDGANDIDMLTAANLGVAFNAKAATRAAADTAVNVPYLDSVLFLLGITREEIEAADAVTSPEDQAPDLA